MRILTSLFTIAASIYVLLALTVYLLQGKMVFLSGLPGRALTATPGDIGLEYEDVALTTSDNERLHGWYVPATDGRGVVLFFHGNAGNISHRLDSIRIFHQLGLDTLIIDYRGYGQSTGKTSEQGTYLDAQAAWSYLVDERGIPGSARYEERARSDDHRVQFQLGGGHGPPALPVSAGAADYPVALPGCGIRQPAGVPGAGGAQPG